MDLRARDEQHRDLAREEWQPYFEAINRRLAGEDLWATVEIYDDDAGGKEADRLPLDGITHEDGDDQVAIGLGGRGERFPAVLWHFVDQPRMLHVHETADGEPLLLELVSQGGAHTLVTLSRPSDA